MEDVEDVVVVVLPGQMKQTSGTIEELWGQLDEDIGRHQIMETLAAKDHVEEEEEAIEINMMVTAS